MKRLVSSLPLTALLFVVWLLLNQSVSPGTLLMGAVLAVLVPLGTKGLRPGSVTMRKPLVAFKLWAIVMRDFVRSTSASPPSSSPAARATSRRVFYWCRSTCATPMRWRCWP